MGSELKGTKGKGGKGMERLEESDPKTLTIHWLSITEMLVALHG